MARRRGSHPFGGRLEVEHRHAGRQGLLHLLEEVRRQRLAADGREQGGPALNFSEVEALLSIVSVIASTAHPLCPWGPKSPEVTRTIR